MKKIILLTLMFETLFIAMKAQNYYMLPDSNAVWVYAVVGGPYPQYTTSVQYYYSYTIEKDTIINNKTYKKIKRVPPVTNSSCGRSVMYRNDRLQNKIWGVIEGDTSEYIIFDYNIGIKDTIKNMLSSHIGNNLYLPYCDIDLTRPPFTYLPNKFTLVDAIIDTILNSSYLNPSFKQWILYPPYSIWIDKIGNKERAFWNGMYLTSEFGNELICFSVNDTIYYYTDLNNPFNTYSFPFRGRCDTLLTNINDLSKNQKQIDIFYNSLSHLLNIKNLHSDKNYTFILNNILGQNLFQQSFNAVSEYSIHLELPQGIYIAEIYNNSSPLLRKKIIIYDK